MLPTHCLRRASEQRLREVRVTTPRLPFWEQTAFEKYHDANPHVLIALERFTREAFEAGHAHIGIDFVHARARWYTSIETTGDDFKLSNRWRPFYARLIMQRNPDMSGVFRLRKAAADSEITVPGITPEPWPLWIRHVTLERTRGGDDED